MCDNTEPLQSYDDYSLTELEAELLKWKVYEPVNNMGKFAKATRINELIERINIKKNEINI